MIRANEAVISAAAAERVALVSREAPRAEIRFELETADDVTDLRQGHVDLAIGSYGDATTDIEHEPLLEERLLAIVRKGHPLTTKTKRPGVKQFAALDHIVVSRMGRRRNALDIALYERGLDRKVVAVVPSFAVAIVMVARSDATTVAPSRMTSMFVECGLLSTYQSPIPPPPVTISQLWHASNTADPTHQWLRSCLHRVARTV